MNRPRAFVLPRRATQAALAGAPIWDSGRADRAGRSRIPAAGPQSHLSIHHRSRRGDEPRNQSGDSARIASHSRCSGEHARAAGVGSAGRRSYCGFNDGSLDRSWICKQDLGGAARAPGAGAAHQHRRPACHPGATGVAGCGCPIRVAGPSALALIIGLGIGVVSSLLGVAGGELIILLGRRQVRAKTVEPRQH